MEIVNTTPYLAKNIISTDKNGQEHFLTIIKATFTIPEHGSLPVLIKDKPMPIIDIDTFSGEPAKSTVTFESDYAPIKKRCDVLLNGCAYAPNETAAETVLVGIKINEVCKVINVIGERRWKYSMNSGAYTSPPQLFLKKEISYDTAYGGIDDFPLKAEKHTAYLKNPVGIGYHKEINFECVNNTPAPNTEEPNISITTPDGHYRPMSFGSIGRGWPSRVQFAGTYDDEWQEDQFPFLPKDFDERYFQAAPEDQQTDFLKGGEIIQLINLSPEHNIQFTIPPLKQKKVVYYFFNGDYKIADFNVDTLHLFPEEKIFTLTARASIPFYGDPFSCSKVIIGRGSKGWQNALNKGKRYIPSIQQLHQYKKKETTR